MIGKQDVIAAMERAVENGSVEQMAEAIRRLVPEAHRQRYDEITALTGRFAERRLTPMEEEYALYCRLMAAACCQEGSPVVAGRARAAGWAAGIVFTLGRVNFLSDTSFEPALNGDQVAAGFGVSPATMHNKSRAIREGLDLMPHDVRWTLPSRLMDNPLVWMLETEEGFIFDARSLPYDQQVEAYEAGLIPFVPDDHLDEVADDDPVVGRLGFEDG